MALEFQSAGLSDALVILGAAGVIIPAFSRARITPVIGFILVGLLVGPYGLGAFVGQAPWLEWVTISDVTTIAPFAELGIILLLFSIGLELSFARLWAMRAALIGFGAAQLFGAAALIATLLIAVGQPTAAAIGLGLALSLSSTALVMPIVGTKSAVGRLALAMLLFEDLALVPIVFLLGALASTAAGSGLNNLFQTLGYGGVTVVVMMVLGRWLLPPLFAQAARTKSAELFLSASLLVVIVASLATSAVGLSPIVGALVAGLLIAETKYHGEVDAMIAPFKGLALGVFLISVGMSVDLGLAASSWKAVAAAVVGVLVINAVVIIALLRSAGVAPGIATETGVLLASPSETTLIVLASAAQAQLIGANTEAFWTVVTAIGLTITPLLARIGHDVARRIEWATGAKQEEPHDSDEARTILIGFGRVGRLVSQMLDVHNQPYVAIEADVDVVTLARRDGKPVVFGDAARTSRLDTLHLENAKAVVMTMDDPVQAVRLTAALRKRFPTLTIVARARDADHAAELYRAGATDAVPETLESSLQLSEAVLVDLGVAMGPVIASVHEKRDELRTQIRSAALLSFTPTLGPLKR
jgi:monovalent cation:H+ antiporter-2, CPA2 family